MMEHFNAVHFRDLKDLVNKRLKQDNPIAFCYCEKKTVIDITVKDFKREIDALGTFLFKEGVKDTTVALIGENSYRWILSYFAIVCGGNVVIPLDKELPDEDVNELIQRSGATALIYADGRKAVAEQNPQLKTYAMDDFESFIEAGQEAIDDAYFEFVDYEIDPEKLSAIIFTSGTTGKPKGVMLNQRNFATDVMAAAENVYATGTTLLTLPLHHTFAFTTSVLAVMSYGQTIAINSSIKNFKRDIKEMKPQNMFLVPLYVEALYKNIWKTAQSQNKEKLLRNAIKVSNGLRKVHVDIRKKLFASVHSELGGNLEMIVSGGAPLNEKYVKEFDALGIQILNGYGITECSPVVAVNCILSPTEGSVGRILSCCEAKTVDGEIYVKGSNVMMGYFGDEGATNASFDGEWFKTGDLGEVRDNHLFITGRKKNLIILSNGKNVSPEELEEKILEIPNVLEVVVREKDDKIMAEIYAEETDGIREAIQEFNAGQPSYKRIQKVIFRKTEFDKTTTKKIKR